MKQNVFFKNMRRVLPLCMILLVSGLTSCNGEASLNTQELDQEGTQNAKGATRVEMKEVSSFFNSTLPNGESILRDFFPSPSLSNSQNDTCYVINSRAKLEELYSGDKELPVINFEEYSLILGMTMAPAGYSLENKTVDITDDAILVTITMKMLEDASIAAFVPYYYWGLYEKLPQKVIVTRQSYIR